VAHDAVRDGAVRPLLAHWALPEQEIHAVFTSPRLLPTKVKGFVEFLQQHFDGPWWAAPASTA
jgi:DNA-binding transcriptional LysR family regulator